MNKIVREHYPVADLPDNLRAGLEPGTQVRVTIEAIETNVHVAASTEAFSLDDLFARAKPSFASFDEVSTHVREMRNDWSDRR